VKRRELITLLGGAAVAWPVAAHAQQPKVPVIGYLGGGSAAASAQNVAVFRQSLAEAGYGVGRNAAIEYRFAEGQYDRLPAMAAELVRSEVSLIVAGGGTAPALAAKAATATIPIVFSVTDDPVALGLVVSFARPGGNATGINFPSPSWRQRSWDCCTSLSPPPSASDCWSTPIIRPPRRLRKT
jgi:putative ABC transport system substrate-binding protein